MTPDGAGEPDKPLLADALRAGGFTPGANPGTWHGHGRVAVDLLVPAALSGAGGRRGARLPVHGNRVARRTHGIEAAIVDCEHMNLASFEDNDSRKFTIRVAGAGALLVAKAIKIAERREQPNRLRAKDALDMLRLLQATDTEPLAEALASLTRDVLAGETTRAALAAFRDHATRRDTLFTRMAVEAVGTLDDPDVIAESMIALALDLLAAYDALIK